ncbi:hypothetical protein SASPL_113289 [Salvia splendens]|uniref:ARGOS-like protein n=1 Tax=Salvia splendens TaxID=180675 RepID=A0A8X8ZZD5_SALSN|nr:hypothetical protein SASPL_113289 [Salvia splendens]
MSGAERRRSSLVMNVEYDYSKKKGRGKDGISGQRKRSSQSSQGYGGKIWQYFTLESVVLLACLTVSLLILPLVLPPLPPPPFLLLLLLPIFILGLLMFLAFMPFNATT